MQPVRLVVLASGMGSRLRSKACPKPLVDLAGMSLVERALVGASHAGFDEVVVVHAPQQTRIERLVALRGLTEAEARARVTAQASDEERLALADRVVDSGGSLEQTLARADELWAELSRRR